MSMIRRQTGPDPIWQVMAEQGRMEIWLARRTGVSLAHVSSMATGRRRPTVDWQRRAAEALNLPVEVLFLPATRMVTNHSERLNTADIS